MTSSDRQLRLSQINVAGTSLLVKIYTISNSVSPPADAEENYKVICNVSM